MVTARSEPAAAVPPSWGPHFFRFLAWSVVTVLFAFLLNVYLTFWRGWPGAGSVLADPQLKGVEKGRVRFGRKSLARQLGIAPVDVSQAGPRE